MAFNWTCPHCETKTTINSDDHKKDESNLKIRNADGLKSADILWIVCPNTECNKLSLYIRLYELNYVPQIYRRGDFIKEWTLIPNTKAKVYPDYIPIAIRQDYEEAYTILELSPKASATLSRRCLQGMIRDFWGVKKGRLFDEINEIEEKVDPLTWKSIDAIRKVGNIGAHMEKDINLIIEVEPKEAQLLIQLIEMLIEEWYIHRHERELKLNLIVDIAETKDKAKKNE
ncbi:DUF4145 domain-containing protein [Gelidibacter sp. F63206]|uniref:DUF4145 domain-containing protein n=1 Tax=Gelidibacter sp. F63206 TaxID=2926425 RepID=UPI001FF2B05A|nr:DUF4145 domain-containing protein [Gelidibacter sp. F63206]MCK0115360.1 DUF4145 domain-containing protein [Gelidibacter sp. F63206]